METTDEQTKLRVLEAFNTLFSRRDYAATEKCWSPPHFRS